MTFFIILYLRPLHREGYLYEPTSWSFHLRVFEIAITKNSCCDIFIYKVKAPFLFGTKTKLLIHPAIIENTLDHCVKSVQIRSFFWSVFSRIRTEYGETRSISPYSVRMRENKDQKKLHIWTLFCRSVCFGSFDHLRNLLWISLELFCRIQL